MGLAENVIYYAILLAAIVYILSKSFVKVFGNFKPEYDSMEEYMEHLKNEHPEIYKERFNEGSKNAYLEARERIEKEESES